MDHSYDSQSDSVEIIHLKRDQRRIIDQDSATYTDDETSLPSHSNESQLLYSLRRRNHRKDVSSSEFEEGCFETAIIDSILHSNPILIKPFHQNLNPQQQRPTKTTTRLENERRDIMTTYPPATTIINNYSSEGRSGSLLLER